MSVFRPEARVLPCGSLLESTLHARLPRNDVARRCKYQRNLPTVGLFAPPDAFGTPWESVAP
jgi:hypothetical protein